MKVIQMLIMMLVLWNANAIAQITPNELRHRAEYANQNFSEGSTPGARTDRGRVYIGLGPPDELKTFNGPQYPFQRWTYRQIPGIGSNIEIEFVDQYGKGVYRIVPWSPVGNDKASVEDRKQFQNIQEKIRQTLKKLPKR